MFKRFSDFIKGYVQIEVNGSFCEKFLKIVCRLLIVSVRHYH